MGICESKEKSNKIDEMYQKKIKYEGKIETIQHYFDRYKDHIITNDVPNKKESFEEFKKIFTELNIIHEMIIFKLYYTDDEIAKFVTNNQKRIELSKKSLAELEKEFDVVDNKFRTSVDNALKIEKNINKL
uniref:Uncharacterized protein n=1 Tax=viral metagenome TaxID=1070528 RepID=A0A6C0ED41_9ZZZZ